MKIVTLLPLLLLLTLPACQDTHDSEPYVKQDKTTNVKPSSDHILIEAYEEQRSVHYFDPNVLVYDRMILTVALNAQGQLFVNGQPSSYDALLQEVHNFYQANRDLGPKLTKEKKEDPYYNWRNYPFFNYFDKDSFKSYLDQLQLMAKTDDMAQQHYMYHQKRFKSFEAVPDGTVLPFMEFGALILIRHHETTEDSKIDALQKKIANHIYVIRDIMAQQEFSQPYDIIRNKAANNDAKAIHQLICLQEMVPAYIMKKSIKSKGSTVEEETLQLPASPTPNIEVVQ